MFRGLVKRLGFTKPKPPVLKKKRKSVAEKKQEQMLDKIVITIDGNMIPLSDIHHKGKLYKEVRRLPKEIRTGILAGLTRLHQDGFNELEYNAENRELILTNGTKQVSCTCTYRFLMKEHYAISRDALELLNEHLRKQ